MVSDTNSINSPMIDTHAHLDMDDFDRDREDVISRAHEAGVTTIITIGINLESSRKAVDLAENHPRIYAVVGVHPHGAERFTAGDLAGLEKLTVHPRVVAVGETGVDLFRNYAPEETQRLVMLQHLGLAAKVDKPVIIHCRQGERVVIPALRDWVGNRKGLGSPGVIHCFNGDSEAARQYLNMGFYIAFGAYTGYPMSKKLHPVINIIPADRLVVETDCPFLPPQSRRGQRNEPSYIPLTVQALAQIRGVPAEDLARMTTDNARKLFRLGD
jgi:TatD DNase family protein